MIAATRLEIVEKVEKALEGQISPTNTPANRTFVPDQVWPAVLQWATLLLLPVTRALVAP